MTRKPHESTIAAWSAVEKLSSYALGRVYDWFSGVVLYEMWYGIAYVPVDAEIQAWSCRESVYACRFTRMIMT
jgi:hypothetical protein